MKVPRRDEGEGLVEYAEKLSEVYTRTYNSKDRKLDGEKEALNTLYRSLILHRKLSDFEEPLNRFERKIFDNIWRITDHIVAMAKMWIYMRPVECLGLEKIK